MSGVEKEWGEQKVLKERTEWCGAPQRYQNCGNLNQRWDSRTKRSRLRTQKK